MNERIEPVNSATRLTQNACRGKKKKTKTNKWRRKAFDCKEVKKEENDNGLGFGIYEDEDPISNRLSKEL